MAVADFNRMTRQKQSPITGVGGGAYAYSTVYTFPIPRVGLLQGVIVTLRGVTNTLTGASHGAGFSALINRLRLTLNSGIDLFNTSGPGYHWLVRPALDNTFDPLPTVAGATANGRTAIASGTTFSVDFYIPVALNLRDAVGLLMLQNEQTLATLTIETPAQTAAVGTTLTFTGTPTITVYPVWFTLPPKAEDMPDLTMLHQILEEQIVVSAAGDYTYVWPRGNIYLQMLHGTTTSNTAVTGLGFADASFLTTAGTPGVKVRVNQSDFLYQYDQPSLDVVSSLRQGQARLAGTIPLNFMASAGLGMYDQARDTIDSADYTDLATVITLANACTVFNIRRQLVPIGGA